MGSLDPPKVADLNESSDRYSRIVAIFNGKWRVIECRDHMQWILQSRDSIHASVGRWRGRSYCRTRKRCCGSAPLTPGKIAPTTAVLLAALPDWIEAGGSICRRPIAIQPVTGLPVAEAKPSDRD
jgi:hypothetical protein